MANPGLILLDALLRPLYANPEALRILAYPEDPKKLQTLDDVIKDRLRAVLNEEDFASSDGLIREYRSGKRKYLCRVLLLGGQPMDSRGMNTVAVMFERSLRGSFDFPGIAKRYNLTPRETQTVELLMYGLTSKEIANHLAISPNTVKAFLRVIMLKMGVTTRTGIVGRILENQLDMAKSFS